MQLTIEGKLIAKDECPTGYSSFIIETDSLPEILKSEYLTPIICLHARPNWEVKTINIGDIGYFKVIQVKGGEDQYSLNGEKVYYRSSGLFLENFTLKKEEIDNLNIKF